MAITTVPTLGYNVETLVINGKEITILDVGGDWNYRHGLWRHFIPGADGIIFVVDSSNEFQIDAAKTALCGLYGDCEVQLKRSVLLVFANKQDQLDALSVAEVKDRIGIGLETIQAEGGRWSHRKRQNHHLVKLHVGEVVSAIPTHDFNMETITIEGTKFAL
ncbi:hypothetical protein EC957_001352 [Mortierella hygrophila]|uniref:ADP-ribosylation factor n=1 Tax=Mortierella hygrophila TaxID=979708 RepID=A0A9P6F5L8_9FUNG|nr:hypothetical protein EC957_001352 [Mortierella hygrophila]